MAKRGEPPLLGWLQGARAAELRRCVRRRRSAWWGAAIALGCASLAATIVAPPRPLLVWNASASAPVGFYAVAPASRVARGEMVIARLPESVRLLAVERRYVGADVPLVKRVAGVAGDRVCALGERIAVSGMAIATRRPRDGLGRALPWWRGCRTLSNNEVLLLNADAPDSFDGRYFGLTRTSDVIGKATSLWMR